MNDQFRMPMDSVRVEEVVITTIARRGAGIEGDPIRVLTEVWTRDGQKIAEHDPCASAASKPMGIAGEFAREERCGGSAP